jgi:hypothetical protein
MNRRLLLLGSAALALGLVLLWDRGAFPPIPDGEVPVPVAEQPPPPAGESPAAQALLNPLDGLQAESFTAMLDRPLFNPGRSARPPEPPPEPPPPPMEETPPEPPPAPPGPLAQDFVLVAVAAGPSGHVAAVRLASTGEVLYLREGQPVMSWNVMKVNDRSVVIGTPESNVEITLFDSNEGDEAPVPMDQDMPPETYVEPEMDLNQDLLLADPPPQDGALQ